MYRDKNCFEIRPDFHNYFGFLKYKTDYYEQEKEIEKYIEVTFIPSVNEIMDQVINLFNTTIWKKSCITRPYKFPSGSYIVNDEIMEDYIYRFISLRKKIDECIKIYYEFVESVYTPKLYSELKSLMAKVNISDHDTEFTYRPDIDRIFCIEYNEKHKYIAMFSWVENHKFVFKINVEEYHHLFDIIKNT